MGYRTKIYLLIEAEVDENLDPFLKELHFEGSASKRSRRDGSFYLELGANTDYEPYVSDMIRVCLGSLLKKPEEFKALKGKYHCRSVLCIVPHLVDSEEPQQCLSLEKDIIEWLHLSDSEMDLDYYLA